mgnify:CR=1 FL=1|jgi:hypothetical protein
MFITLLFAHLVAIVVFGMAWVVLVVGVGVASIVVGVDGLVTLSLLLLVTHLLFLVF